MKNTHCPYCREEIKARASICKHCHLRVYRSREELVMNAITELTQLAPSSIAIPSVSECGALCHARTGGNKVALNECLDNCKAAEAVALVAVKLHRELHRTFEDIVWGGGDIDPIPFEKSVRERFSHIR